MTDPPGGGLIRTDFEEHLALVATALDPVVTAVEAAAAVSIEALASGGKVLAFGNGGSAAQAQHFAAELVGRYQADRRAIPAIALPADPATLTALANDYGFEAVFARQVEALGRPGDIVVAISTSGTSPNVVAGVRAAVERGCLTVALTGEGGGDLGPLVDQLIAVPSRRVPRIQEIHAIALHTWAAALERAITG